ncbi:hypothetical protein H6P81_002733 [Aristolochia fimbriata]|uniref:Uncharacterized protein n=1 Tax=Aristolochia fimbriata TaxID=158543 RepID=A0AAV7FAK6_ARIFI|nr:hypothetical protein H6P81_002733 [Aristolochia fimbriata]
MTSATCEIIWLNVFLEDMGIQPTVPMKLFCDNQEAIHIASNLVFLERTKHIEVDCHFVCEIMQKKIITTHVPSLNQDADIFSKALGKYRFFCILNNLG